MGRDYLTNLYATSHLYNLGFLTSWDGGGIFCEYVAHTVLTPFDFPLFGGRGVQGVAYLSGLDMSRGMRLSSWMDGWGT